MPDIYMDVDTALAEVPINLLPAIDDTDFKTIEDALVYNQAGLDLVWNFVTTAGVQTQTEVTPTSGGDYDPTNQGNGLYSLEIPASGGASINNDAEGHGWFSGVCTGVYPFRGPTICFRAAGLNNLLINSAFSATRGLAGTAIPAAVANAAGGIPISVAGMSLDTKLANTNEITVARMGALTDWINGGRLDLLLDGVKAVTDALPDSGALTAIDGNTARLTAARAQVLTDWVNGGRLDLLLDGVPTTAEFEARTLPSDDYVVVTDTLARVTLVDTVSDNSDLVDAAAVKLAMEASGSDLDYIIKALVNKLVVTEATGNTEMFNDASGTLGSITTAFSSDGTYTTRKRMVI